MNIEWGETAEAELSRLVDYDGQFDPGLPDVLIDRAYHATLSLESNPRIGSPVGRANLRKWPVKKTPFMLLYRVEHDYIYIVRVIHSASDWQSSL